MTIAVVAAFLSVDALYTPRVDVVPSIPDIMTEYSAELRFTWEWHRKELRLIRVQDLLPWRVSFTIYPSLRRLLRCALATHDCLPSSVRRHPEEVRGEHVGMSGARITLHLALELQRRGGGDGAAALCGGGGQGDALIIRVPTKWRLTSQRKVRT
ncbi:hypothetical protein RW1_100_00030 [Rhodococcus wratislaviensis NBRC 100605]|uniref:Thiolase C-terminal domain-containing protein n=1 Tax=Rhodococcus wratislaviensis NBRC 100605 TaxID=1219028 RepID=X0Q587_RHOWR|nr:hypothetical protein RW1_100_00030 [Rhodococcus wratislaviensis NBRC 100605]